MRIPDTIKIGARTYRVYIIDPDPDTVFDLNADGGEILGQTDYKALTIKLSDNLAQAQREQTLLHEIVHAIAFDMGYTGEHNEREVDLLASALHRLILDNPLLFANPNHRK